MYNSPLSMCVSSQCCSTHPQAALTPYEAEHPVSEVISMRRTRQHCARAEKGMPCLNLRVRVAHGSDGGLALAVHTMIWRRYVRRIWMMPATVLTFLTYHPNIRPPQQPGRQMAAFRRDGRSGHLRRHEPRAGPDEWRVLTGRISGEPQYYAQVSNTPLTRPPSRAATGHCAACIATQRECRSTSSALQPPRWA